MYFIPNLVYKNTNIIKGTLRIYLKQFVEKILFSRFQKWKNIINGFRLQELNTEVEILHYQKKENFFRFLDKIFNRLVKNNPSIMSMFFERLVWNTKIKNSIKDYGVFYKKIFSLVNKDQHKYYIHAMRKSYDKVLKLSQAISTITKKKYTEIQIKGKTSRAFTTFQYFIKWKRETIIGFSAPGLKYTLSISMIITIIKNILMKKFGFFSQLKNQFITVISKPIIVKSFFVQSIINVL